jgi:serine/threonine-protein kinase
MVSSLWVDELAGNTLDSRYVLERRIGSGETGEVYEAEDIESKRRVAIKLLDDASFDDARRAAHAATAVASEHIVPIADVGSDARLGVYVVTELLAGEDLATRLLKEGGRLPIADAIAIGVQAARALAKAHAAGVVHGDLAPGNMFLTTREDGSPCLKILDFGIARLSRGGTPMYMSPERAAGRAIDARADLWSLGAVLYEMLSGREPWEWAPTFELLLAKIEREQPAPLSEVAPWIAPAIAEVVESVFVHDRGKRPADAGAFADALARAARAPASQTRIATGTYAPGHTVHGYRILSRLRSGGMATLYLAARQGAAGFSRPVAIKMIHPHLADDPECERMFVEEARMLARIVHPNVVHVEELIEHEGSLHLVMEYVEGCSLGQLSSALTGTGRRFVPDVAAYIAMQVASGLHAAHEARGENGEPLGIVHRDVSPQNVLVARQGHVKLIDFGIAKVRSGDRSTTGSLRGKIRYMSPEQAWGRPVDRRTDIYALGVVLWEMLTGRRLFEAPNDFALLENVRSPHIVPPAALVPGVPRALSDVVMAALEPEPARRPRTANDLRRMLAEAVPTTLAIEPESIARLVALVVADDARLTSIVREAMGASAPSIAMLTTRSFTGTEEALQTMSLALPATSASLTTPRRDPRLATGLVLAVGAIAIIAALISLRKAAPLAANAAETESAEPPPPIATVTATATITATATAIEPPPSATVRRSPPRRAPPPPPQTVVSSRPRAPEPAKSSSVQIVEGVPIVEPAH